MTQQLTDRQIAWRVAQDLPRDACVHLGAGMPLLVPDYVAHERGMVFERGTVRATSTAGYRILGASEVAPNGDLVAHEAPAADEPSARSGAPHVFVMATYFAPNGRPTLVPECSAAPTAAGCVTLYTDIAVFELRDGKAWLREIIEGITLHALQAETDVQLHVAPYLRLLQAPDLR